MPFNETAKMTLTNEGEENISLYYQIDYTVGDRHPENFGRLHVCFLRENSTTLKQDFEILPKRTGEGRFIGTVLGIRTLEGNWWGEGEVKIYMGAIGTRMVSYPCIAGICPIQSIGKRSAALPFSR